MRWTLVALGLAGCSGGSSKGGDSVPEGDRVDADQDGSESSVDCDDGNAAVHPGADEVCDGFDNDCNDQVDDDATDSAVFYLDVDGDGFGLLGTDVRGCAAPAGYVTNAEDCDDTDAALHPETQWYSDDDGDGYGDTASGTGCVEPFASALEDGDCDDDNPVIYPTAPEYCDSFDNDCNGTMDDAAVDADPWYLDEDGDGYGDEATEYLACWHPSGYIDQALDCDDTDDAVHPGAIENCFDAADSDCTGRIDNGCTVVGTAESDWQWRGTSSPAQLGWSTADLGDMNGDGRDDLGVTAPKQTDGTFYTTGAAYVLDGTSTTGSYTDVSAQASVVIYGDTSADELGQLIETAGDVNDDGELDLVVGSINTDAGACSYCGDSRVFFGPLTGTFDQLDADIGLAGRTDYDNFGDAATHGDFDGDGKDDLIIGGTRSSADKGASFTNEGVVYFFRGPDLSGDLDVKTADASFVGDFSTFAGSGLTSLRDVDGDGVSDIAIGAYDHSAEGAVFLLFGPVSGPMDSSSADVTYSAASAGDGLGYRTEWAGDVDGDGSLDLALTARYADVGGPNSGAAYVIYGPLDASMNVEDAVAVMYGPSSSAFGAALSEGGDVDGDGKDDVVVGDPMDDDAGSNAGAIAIFFGPVEGPRSSAGAEYIIEGTTNAFAGYDVDLLDFDGDGALDVGFGAYQSDGYGRAFVVANTTFSE